MRYAHLRAYSCLSSLRLGDGSSGGLYAALTGIMHIFVDESGIHKDSEHSTFCLVYVAIRDQEAIERGVREIEAQYHIEDFHWSDHSWVVREKFFRAIMRLPFSVKIAVFKNPIKPADALIWALLHLLAERHFLNLIIDGKQPRWIERQIKKTLRDKGISVRKLKTARHESSAGIRLADAFAGLSRAYYDSHSEKAAILWNFAQKKVTTQLMGGQVDG